MPVVPRIGVGNTGIANLPGARLEAPDTSAGTEALTQGLRDVGRVAFQIGEQEREKADTAQLLEADRKLSQWEVDRLYTPETGLLNRKGKEAFGTPDEAMPEFDQLASETEAGLSDRAKLRFRQMANGRRADIERQLARHVAQQSDIVLKTEAAAHEQTALANIAVHAGDPERVATEVDRMWAAKLATLRGMQPEVIKAERQGMMAAVHGGIIDQFLARQEYGRAVEYFEQNRDELGEQADEYARTVREASYVIKETEQSDRIMASLGSGPAAIAEARKIADPFLRERVENRIDREAARRERLENQYERGVREAAWSKMEAAPPGTELTAVFTPRELVQISGQPGLLQQMENRMTGRLRGLAVETDPRVLDRLHRLANTDQKAFATYPLEKDFDKLATQDRDYFLRVQAEIQKPDKAADYATEAQQLGVVYSDLGISPTGQNGEKVRGQFMQAYLAEKQAFSLENKHPPNADDRQKIMDRLMLPFVKDRWPIFGGDVRARAFQVPAEERADFRAEVPEADRQQIVAAYESTYGRPPNELQIADYYRRAAAKP